MHNLLPHRYFIIPARLLEPRDQQESTGSRGRRSRGGEDVDSGVAADEDSGTLEYLTEVGAVAEQHSQARAAGQAEQDRAEPKLLLLLLGRLHGPLPHAIPCTAVMTLAGFS